jgi:sugar/nucleoside kinase (ribokinase family)
VDQSLIARSDRPTTLAFVVLTGGNASYAFYDENTAGRMLSEADLPAIPETCEAGFFGGISLAVEPCADAYTALAARMAQAGKLVMLDPNIRPGFIADEGRYRARMDRLLSLADVVKVSDEDLAWLDGRRRARRAGRGDACHGAGARPRHPRGRGRDGLWRGRPGHTTLPRRRRSWTPSARATRSTRAFSRDSDDAGRCRPTRCARACPRRR